MTEAYQLLKDRLARICDLNHAAAVLEWDQETYMPDGAVESRGHQVATLRQVAHEFLVSDELQRALENAESEIDDPDALSDEASLARIARRDIDQAIKIPATLVAEMALASSRAKQAWKSARETDSFSDFEPHLQALIGLSIRQAEALGYDKHVYDALLDLYEPGLKKSTLDSVFEELRSEIVPLVETLTACNPPDDSMLRRKFPRDAQWQFGVDVIRDFGYDFNTGRQDESAHPFTTTFSISDVRLTTRLDEHFFNPAFFGTLHEAGHGMYEQGVDINLERTPLADGTSLGIHESQSRLWENQIGRGRPFWEHYYPKAQNAFPEALADVSLDAFYRAINRVSKSLIRVEADEVTYNLHIMVRFELETHLIDGSLSVRDLPGAWNDRMEAYLGIRPASDADGVLQDIHWALGVVGYFPTYTLGNLMSAQLFDQAIVDIPNLEDRIGQGEFNTLLDWLRTNVHRFGRKKTAHQILFDTTGNKLSSESWIQYIRSKYEVLYGT